MLFNGEVTKTHVEVISSIRFFNSCMVGTNRVKIKLFPKPAVAKMAISCSRLRMFLRLQSLRIQKKTISTISLTIKGHLGFCVLENYFLSPLGTRSDDIRLAAIVKFS